MAFIQVIDYETSNPDEVRRFNEEWERATQGKHSAKRIISTSYHDDPNRHCAVVFFDSYEDAMKNSELPETQEYARKFNEAVNGEPTYFNLDVIEDRTL